MTILLIAAALIVSGWLIGLTAVFWASYRERGQVHPIYRPEVIRNSMYQDEPIIEELKHCKCNTAGDRPNRALYVKGGKTFCARCEKPVHQCPDCGALFDGAVISLCKCKNGALQLSQDVAASRRRAAG